eukprot:1423445-Amphidinium_carterae.1
MAASAELEEVNSALCVKVPEGDYNSIGGFMCHVIDRIPVMGEAVVLVTAAAPVRLVVKDVDDRKVLKIEAFQDVVNTLEPVVELKETSDELADASTATVLEVQTELVAVVPGTATGDEAGNSTLEVVSLGSGNVQAVVVDDTIAEDMSLDGNTASGGRSGEDLFQELSALSPGIRREDYFASGVWDTQSLLNDLESLNQDKPA